MMDFPNISEILDFLIANLRIPDKSMISGRTPGFLGTLGIPEIMHFPIIYEILDFW